MTRFSASAFDLRTLFRHVDHLLSRREVPTLDIMSVFRFGARVLGPVRTGGTFKEIGDRYFASLDRGHEGYTVSERVFSAAQSLARDGQPPVRPARDVVDWIPKQDEAEVRNKIGSIVAEARVWLDAQAPTSEVCALIETALSMLQKSVGLYKIPGMLSLTGAQVLVPDIGDADLPAVRYLDEHVGLRRAA